MSLEKEGEQRESRERDRETTCHIPHPLRDSISLSHSLQFVLFNLISFILGGTFCDHFPCGVGRVEGVVVDRSRKYIRV